MNRNNFSCKQLVLASALSALTLTAAAQNDNIVYKDSNVRFTLVTDGTVRMEYAPDGKFLDNKSFIAVNRSYPEVKYKKSETAKKVVISTDYLTLTYTKGSGPLTERNLSIVSAKTKKKPTDGKRVIPFAWHPGQKDVPGANLKGTYLTLDGYDGDSRGDTGKMPIEDGLLSRSGWTLIDDSEGYVFDNSDWQWVAHRPNEGKTQDMYFLAYGNDYKKALHDFTVFAGKEPLPPRYAFGYWWSRYWCYSDNELRQLVSKMHSYSIPMDVLVVDMDWHYTEEGRGGWTGYTWNKRLFPSPAGFMKWAKQQQLQTTVNLHPADGIKYYEDCYADMARWMGMDPAEKKDIPWNASSKRFMQGWYDKVLRPMERDGIDFWWLDWQQWNNDKEFPRLSNVWWINYATFTDMERHHDTRPMLYHRWGGLGNHRYQIGFSGDAIISWKSLDFQPYYNSTASNVLYGYWSHDIGGHMGADSINPEMYIRWMQFGAFSPILRTHSTKNAGLNKEPWVFADKERDIIRDIIKQRYSLAPYIYTMARHAYDTGVSLCRPMYYDYPDAQEAYTNRNEYMFGDNYLVYPITQPMNDGVSLQKVWLPDGNDWYELTSGTMLKGGQTVERRFLLDEYPIYVKAGSIIPQYGDVKNLRRNDEAVTVTVYPGNVDAQFVMYEDNGNDKQYATAYASTLLSATHSADGTLRVSIGARKGEYSGMPAHRQYRLKLVASAVPEKVVVDGKQTDFEYDGNNLSLMVDIPETDCSNEKTIEVVYAKDAPVLTDGLIGKFRHIQQNCIAVKYHNPGIVFAEPLGTMESAGIAMTYNPEKQKQIVEIFRKNYASLADILKQNGIEGEDARKFMLAE